MFVNFNILNQLGSPAINSNTFANRPAAGQTGRLFVSTDTYEIYRDNGTTWDLIGGPGSSTITGSGTAGTIPLWTSTSAIGDSDLRQLSSQALILNSATNDWPTTQLANDAGRFLITNDTNQPMLVLWSKAAFASGDEYGTLNLGAVTALGSTTIGGANIDGGIENNTDGSGYFELKTTNTAGVLQSALTVSSTQIATFKNNVIVNSPGSIGIRTATPGAALDVHSTGTIAQLNSTGTTNNGYLAFQRTGATTFSIGDTYNGGSNYFRIFGSALSADIVRIFAATGESFFTSTETYSSGNSIGVSVQNNLTIPNGVNVGLAALGGVNSNLNLSLGGSTTVANTGRQGLEGSTTIGFTGAGTLTMTQGSTVRAFSALSSVYAFNGSAVGTITHLAGLRICFPDNVGSAVNITNNYALLINNQTTGTGTVTYTNRWGIYQEGASDLNYFAGNLLLGSTTNSGEKLQVTGSAKVTNSIYAIGSEQALIFQRTVGVASDEYALAANAGSAYLYNNTTANVLMTWLEGGNVGIGLNNPLSKFQVNTGTNQNFRVRPGTDVGASNGVAINSRTDDDSALQQLAIRASDVILLPSNNVGINTNTPTGYGTTLQMTSAIGSDTSIVIGDGGGTTTNRYIAAKPGSAGDLFFGTDNGSIRFVTQLNPGTTIGNTRGLFTSGGNLLLGTTTDGGAKLAVNGAASINTTTNGTYSKLIVAGAIHCNNNTTAATTKQNQYGNFYANESSVTGGAGATTIYSNAGPEGSLFVVSGLYPTSGARFVDLVLILGAVTTAPVVISSQTYNSPASRTYTNTGETIKLQLTGTDTYEVFVTGMGCNEKT